MPHAALWVVQLVRVIPPSGKTIRFNAARGFVGGAARLQHERDTLLQAFQCRTRLCGWCSTTRGVRHQKQPRFNAARGFVGGAALIMLNLTYVEDAFQCRTRLCGWCSLVARSPFPPREKKPFWKVSGNLRCLTENM